MLLSALIFASLIAGQPQEVQPAIAGDVPFAERHAGEREGRRIAAAIAAVYWEYEEFAEILHEAEAELHFIRDLVARTGGSNPTAIDSMARQKRREVEERVRRAAERYDAFALLDRAPGAANLLVRYIRQGADLETSRRLLDRMRPDAGPGGLHPLMLAALEQNLTAREAANHASYSEHAPADSGDESLARFEAEYNAWIDTIRLLGRLTGRDQFTRNLLIAQIGRELPNETREPLIATNAALIDTIDRENTDAVVELIEQYGFEALHAASPTISSLITGIVHHGGTTEERRTLLAQIEPMALAGDYSGQQYALMFDRLALREDRPQRFGTQTHCVDGRLEIYTLENEAQVDQWRSDMGLSALPQYFQSLLQSYGEDC